MPFVIIMDASFTPTAVAGHWSPDTLAAESGDGYVLLVDIGKMPWGSPLGPAPLASVLRGSLVRRLDCLASGAWAIRAIWADGPCPWPVSIMSGRFRTTVEVVSSVAAAGGA